MTREVPTPESYQLAARLWTQSGNQRQADTVRASPGRPPRGEPETRPDRGASAHRQPTAATCQGALAAPRQLPDRVASPLASVQADLHPIPGQNILLVRSTRCAPTR
jgi:hypothetical protein